MASKFLPLLFGIGLAIGVAQVQPQLLTGTPTESPSPSKHRTQKETGATSPAESATVTFSSRVARGFVDTETYSEEDNV